MTLRELIQSISDNPTPLLLYFIAIPLLALLNSWISRDEGHRSPWSYVYAALLFAVCIPGIFSVALSVYNFLFERGRLLDANILVQVLPVLAMVLTIVIIKGRVSIDAIPGFDRISSLMWMIAAAFGFMYLLDRTRIIAFVYIPVQYLLLIVVGLVLVFRFSMRRFFA